MKKIGLLKALKLCGEFEKKGYNEQNKIKKERLEQLVRFAKENSPYYHELYKHIDMNQFELTSLPPVNKIDLMKNFDYWITDRQIKLSQIQDFMRNMDNIGRKYEGKYIVVTTSGSTGNPLIALYDDTANNVASAISVKRSYARKEDMLAFIRKGGKSIGIFATQGFYLGNSSVRARLLKMPWKKRQMAVTSALVPIEQIVEELNAFQPAMLGGYPTNIELLIEEQKSGRLHINPVIIMTGGEYLSDTLRKKLKEVFSCYVQTNYSCTEGGTVACECRNGRFHINEDWSLIEVVDKDNNPVEDGTMGDKILLTNLSNYSQPFIRYEVTDRVTMHHGLCGCGKISPWIEIEGRTDDILVFEQNGKEIKVPPLAVYATLKEIHEIRRFQVIMKSENTISLRLEAEQGKHKEDIFLKAQEQLTEFLLTFGVEALIELSEEEPKAHPVSGKFKHILYAKDKMC